MAIQVDNSNNFTVTLAAPTSGTTSLTFPNVAGSSTNGLITNGAGVLTWGAVPVVPIVGITGTVNSTGVNATKPIDAISVSTTGASVNQDIALIPKGNGSLVFRSGANVTTNYGTYCVCIQSQSDGSKVPRGTNDVVLGGDSTSTDQFGSYNVSVANENTATITGLNNTVVGCYGVTIGNQNNAVYGVRVNNSPSNPFAFAKYCTSTPGQNVTAEFNYQHIMPGYGYDPNNQGNVSRYALFHLLGFTAPAPSATTRLYVNGSSGGSTTQSDNFFVGRYYVGGCNVTNFWGYLVACSQNGTEAYAWKFDYSAVSSGALGGTLTVTGSVTAVGGDATLGFSTVSITADSTNQFVLFNVTSNSSNNCRWVAQVQAVRMGAY